MYGSNLNVTKNGKEYKRCGRHFSRLECSTQTPRMENSDQQFGLYVFRSFYFLIKFGKSDIDTNTMAATIYPTLSWFLISSDLKPLNAVSKVSTFIKSYERKNNLQSTWEIHKKKLTWDLLSNDNTTWKTLT